MGDGDLRIEVDVGLIDRDQTQPRQDFNENRLDELARSIKDVGLIEPIIVRRNGGSRYVLIAGERRWLAVKKLGWGKAPVIVKDCDDKLARKLQMVENVVRQDLNPVELARGFQLMMNEGMTAKDIGRALGKDPGSITWTVNILKCRDEVLFLVANGQIKPWVGNHLSRLSENGQLIALRRFQNGKYDAAEMVAICESIYADENQMVAFADVKLPEEEQKAARSFKTAFEQACAAFTELQKLEEEQPGIVAKAMATEFKIARSQIKELRKWLGRLDIALMKRKQGKKDEA